MFHDVYIIGGGRSFLGIENGMYRHMPAEELGASTLKKVLDSMPFDAENIKPDGVIAGNAVGAGGNITRLMTLTAGLSDEIPAVTVDTQCSSGLTAMGMAAERIETGCGEMYIAGGFESSSTAPVRSYNRNHPDYNSRGEKHRSYKAAKFAPGVQSDFAMLQGAERTAIEYGITNEELNRWVLKSHTRAAKARDEGILSDIVFQISENADHDEGIREQMNERLLNHLPAAFPGGQIITAGNACLTNDGAAFVALASEGFVKRYNIKPWGRVLDICEKAGNPLVSPVMAVKVCEKMIDRAGLKPEDIDIYEINEAFAVIDVLFERAYGELTDRYNIFGGALAYGHPFGATGAILTLHALTALEAISGRYGITGIAAAGGMGTAMLVERL